jgi:hypothetical protein
MQPAFSMGYEATGNACCFINDNRLSWGAKGLHLYALSKPDDFRFMLKELVKHSPDGRIKLNGYVKELIQYGYWRHYQLRSEAGSVAMADYLVSECPENEPQAPAAVMQAGLLHAVKLHAVKLHADKLRAANQHLPNTDLNQLLNQPITDNNNNQGAVVVVVDGDKNPKPNPQNRQESTPNVEETLNKSKPIAHQQSDLKALKIPLSLSRYENELLLFLDGLDKETCQQILDTVQSKQKELQKPFNYFCKLCRQAKKGEFTPQDAIAFNKKQRAAQTQAVSKPAPAIEAIKQAAPKLNPEELKAKMSQLKNAMKGVH